MKHYLLGLCLALMAPAAAAQDATVTSVEITDAGIYTRDVQSQVRGEDGVLQSIVANPKLALATTTIPAKLGVTFGFSYRVVGQPDGAVATIRKVDRFPPPGARPPGSTRPLAMSTTERKVLVNRYWFTSYTLEEKWELLPGKWVFEIWQGDRKLASQTFIVVASP